MLRILLSLGALLWLVTAGEAQPSAGGNLDGIAGIIGLVSQDSLRATIAKLQGYGSRHWSMGNRREIALWIGGKMRDDGLTNVALDSFELSGTWQYNVVGTLPGSADPESLIILGGHTDSFSKSWDQAPGADDNASGTAAVLEAARVISLAGYRPRVTLRFLGFAAEEAGLRGSGTYAARLWNDGWRVSAMLNFDMIAYRNRSSAVRSFSIVWYAGSEWLASLDSLMACRYTTLVPLLSTVARSGSDSYSFWINDYPAVFHYEGRGVNPTYHTAMDLLDSLDLEYARDITQTGIATALAIDEWFGSGRSPFGEPEAFALLQNYPNPFNPGTRIRYDVPGSRFVRLAVYDMLGREVALLVNGWKTPGSYSVMFDGRGLASGVYIYRLEAPPTVLARKMVLVR